MGAINSSAFFLAVCGVLLVVSVVFSRASVRTGIPLTLVFLAIGMAAGSEGIGRIAFDDYGLSFRLGTMALAFILFDGGPNTRWSHVRHVLAPAGVLATIGVVITGAMVVGGAHLFGMGGVKRVSLAQSFRQPMRRQFSPYFAHLEFISRNASA